MRRKRILAIASSGGHWEQLLRLRPAFEGHDVTYLTVDPSVRGDVGGAPFHVVQDATRWSKVALVMMSMQVAWRVLRIRPDVIVSTGAAPGFVGIRVGKLLGAKTVWIDSLANAERLSLSGRLAGPHSDLWLTQWAHLSTSNGPAYRGSVL
jgi:UDP-N-acetylglucosamine:LPS N-acetylglucosamine transferase